MFPHDDLTPDNWRHVGDLAAEIDADLDQRRAIDDPITSNAARRVSGAAAVAESQAAPSGVSP